MKPSNTAGSALLECILYVLADTHTSTRGIYMFNYLCHAGWHWY